MYLTGSVTLERAGAVVGEPDLPGKQGRLALTYLILNRTRPIRRSDLAEAIWGDQPPRADDSALSAIVSKLRGSLAALGLDASSVLVGRAGTYAVQLPAGAWVDREVATQAIDRAEGMLRQGPQEARAAWSDAAVATSILRRPFLPADDAPWITAERVEIERLLLRGLDALAEVWLTTGEFERAAQVAEQAVRAAPYHEASYRLLMRALQGSGNRAEAVRAYQRCREVLRADLGVDPAPETEAVYVELLRY